MKASTITRGGLITALGVILLYISSIFPINRFFILTVASCLIPFSVLKINIKGSIAVYAATSLVSLMIIGIRDITIAYILFFGPYNIIKYFVEKMRRLPLEIILKLAYYNLSLFVIILLFKNLFVKAVVSDVLLYGFIIASEFIFLIYDYGITVFINYADRRFKRL